MADLEYTPREVIENKLLAALDDESKVGIIASREDLGLLRRALCFGINETPSRSEQDEFRRMLFDLEQLGKSAFR